MSSATCSRSAKDHRCSYLDDSTGATRPCALPQAGVELTSRVDQLSRDVRRKLAQTLTQMPLPISGDRGFTYAEVTAGGVPLTEIRLETMESRLCPGLYLCGELCDVDGRIGGYNFQWAWASGYIAGVSA